MLKNSNCAACTHQALQTFLKTCQALVASSVEETAAEVDDANDASEEVPTTSSGPADADVLSVAKQQRARDLLAVLSGAETT